MGYQTYWEQISRFDRVIFFCFALFSAVGALSSFGTTIIMAASLIRDEMAWTGKLLLTISFIFSISACFSYILWLVIRSASPAYWAKRAIIPVIVISLPFALIFNHLLSEDMKARPHTPSCTADC
ncbi:MAG TPA: hypothetical protein VHO04_17450 [Sphingopyxis sp.]|uniref:hypothetical protein n=1 Tax=Sphingopyxis sp. TaxID=1908224 RepID=UPI002E32AB2E|nr:hypothetical protein [Sphingopyxis sp.]HEX2814469.1 hypothetical protein [Sphingopyxis sp.]